MDNNLLLISLLLNIFFAVTQAVTLLIIGTSGSFENKDDQKAKEKSDSLIHQAIEKANKILVNAELRGIKLFARQKVESQQVFDDYQGRLRDFEATIEKNLLLRNQEADKSYGQFIEMIEQTIKNHVLENQKMLEQKVSNYISENQKALNSFVVSLNSRIKSEVEEELAQTKATLENYKKKKTKAIDDNILEIMEKTLKVILEKKFSLADHSELVYKALEEAKKEKAFE